MQKKTFAKLQHPFVKKQKTLRKIGMEAKFLKLIKSTYKNPAINITLNGENECFPPKIRKKSKMSPLTIVIQHSTAVLSSTICQEKEIKCI